MVSRLSCRTATLAWGMVTPSLGLVAVLWTTGACSLSSVETPRRDGVGGAATSVLQAAGGSPAGVDPAGGAGGNAGACGQTFKVCVDSCAQDITAADWAPVEQICVDGVVKCPGATVDYGTCPRGTCASHRPYCCDPTTGDVSLAPCADGIRACPAETPAAQSYYDCTPTALAETGCVAALAGQPCGGPAHRCAAILTACACDQPDGDGGMVWSCHFLSGIP